MSAVSVASASHFTPTACAAVSGFGSSSRVMYESFSQRRTKRPRAKKVSWAPDERLCQVRMFASDDAPSQFCMSMFRPQQGLQQQQQQQDHFERNMPSLPPGFGPRSFARANNTAAAVAAMTAQVAWRTPDLVEIIHSWRVVAGNESKEVAAQKERENRVLEAVYPRPSAIPDSPAEPIAAEEDYDDSLTPSISVVAQEDEEMAEVQEEGEHNEMRQEEMVAVSREGNLNASLWAASQGQGMTFQTSRGGYNTSRTHGNATEGSSPASMDMEGIQKDGSDGSMSPDWGSGTRTMLNPPFSVLNGNVTHVNPMLSVPARTGKMGVDAAGKCEDGRGEGNQQKQEQQETSSGASEKVIAPTRPPPPPPPPSAADITMVAAAVLAALGGLGGNGAESMIDQELLLKILKNPSLMNTLLPMGHPSADTGNIRDCGNGSVGAPLPESGRRHASGIITLKRSQELPAAAADSSRGSGESKSDKGNTMQGMSQMQSAGAATEPMRGAVGGRDAPSSVVNVQPAKHDGLRNGGLSTSSQFPLPAPVGVEERCQSRAAAPKAADDGPLLPPGFENSARILLQNGNDIGGTMQSLHLSHVCVVGSGESNAGGTDMSDVRPAPDRQVSQTPSGTRHDALTSPATNIAGLEVHISLGGMGGRCPTPFGGTPSVCGDGFHGPFCVASGKVTEGHSGSSRIGPLGGAGASRAGSEGGRHQGAGGGARGLAGRGRDHFPPNRPGGEWIVDHQEMGSGNSSDGRGRDGINLEFGVQRDGQSGADSGYPGGTADMMPCYSGAPRLGRASKGVCAFYGSSTGCRNGSRCPFLHDPAIVTGRGSASMERDDSEEDRMYRSVPPATKNPFAGRSSMVQGDRRLRTTALPQASSLASLSSSSLSSSSSWSCKPRSNAR